MRSSPRRLSVPLAIDHDNGRRRRDVKRTWLRRRLIPVLSAPEEIRTPNLLIRSQLNTVHRNPRPSDCDGRSVNEVQKHIRESPLGSIRVWDGFQTTCDTVVTSGHALLLIASPVADLIDARY
jgi:hypothetical protein